MPPAMVDSFFSMSSSSRRCQSHHHPLILLSGPPSSGKTSLLFQYAFNSAAQEDTDGPAVVVFLCNRRRLEAKPPYLSRGIDPSSPVFLRIQMKYVDDIDGINNYFAAFHLLDTFPVSAVIIDDFGDLFDERFCQERYNNARGRDFALVRTLALCHNAIAHAKATWPCPCKLLLSDTHHGDSPRFLYIYKRWVSSIYTTVVKGDGSGSFLLKKHICSGPTTTTTTTNLEERMTTAKYSIALQHLVLERITSEEEEEEHRDQSPRLL